MIIRNVVYQQPMHRADHVRCGVDPRARLGLGQAGAVRPHQHDAQRAGTAYGTSVRHWCADTQLLGGEGASGRGLRRRRNGGPSGRASCHAKLGAVAKANGGAIGGARAGSRGGAREGGFEVRGAPPRGPSGGSRAPGVSGWAGAGGGAGSGQERAEGTLGRAKCPYRCLGGLGLGRGPGRQREFQSAAGQQARAAANRGTPATHRKPPAWAADRHGLSMGGTAGVVHVCGGGWGKGGRGYRPCAKAKSAQWRA